jgi:Domain of unknown function (DUF4129)
VQLERIAITLRPRSAWESIDLGYAMVQEWRGPVMKAWFATYIPAAILINLLCWQAPIFAALIMWWLKPAFDRVVLFVLSGAAFGAVPTVRETLGALKRLWWNNGMFAALTYARINFARSFTLPVVQLEGSRGKFASERRKVLGREGRGAAVMLTFICMFFEAIMALSIYGLVYFLMPSDGPPDFSWKKLFEPDGSRTAQYISNAVGELAVTILEPFYVAGGFALYLNCRTAIEGWDVELTFKRLSARVTEKAASTAKRVMSTTGQVGAWCLVVWVALSLSLSHTGSVWAAGNTSPTKVEAPTAQTPPITSPENGEKKSDEIGAAPDDEGQDKDKNKDEDEDEDEARSRSKAPDTGALKAVKKVLASKEFGESEKTWEMRYIGPKWGSDKEEEPPKKSNNLKWLAYFGTFIAESVRVLAWIAGGALVLFLLYLIARHIGVNGWSKGGGRDVPDVLFGLDVRPESLPDDLPAAARRLLAAGDLRGAVGLLYRGALVALIQDGRIEIARGDTELQCVARVRVAYSGELGRDAGNNRPAGTANAQSTETATTVSKPDFFHALVKVWQRVAYARQRVSDDEIAALIDAWPTQFSIHRAAKTDEGSRKASASPSVAGSGNAGAAA